MAIDFHLLSYWIGTLTYWCSALTQAVCSTSRCSRAGDYCIAILTPVGEVVFIKASASIFLSLTANSERIYMTLRVSEHATIRTHGEVGHSAAASFISLF